MENNSQLETPEIAPAPIEDVINVAAEVAQEKRRRWLLLLLVLLLVSLGCTGFLFIRYYRERKPIPELVSQPIQVNYPPHYLFSIYGAERPVGVAVSPTGDRIYVAETGGDRLIKVFDRDGDPLFSFSPPATTSGERSPVYIAIDKTGRVFISDRLQHAIYIYDRDGKYLDTILAPGLTLSEYIASHIKEVPSGTEFSYNAFRGEVQYRLPGQTAQTLPGPDAAEWAPLGLRFDSDGNLWVTNVFKEDHNIRQIPSRVLAQPDYHQFDYTELVFGSMGQDSAQFLYPNVGVMDSKLRLHIMDGNNGRVSVWDIQGNYLFQYGGGNGDGALSLPHGAFIGSKDRLHIVDVVGQDIKVYDVSGNEPAFLYAFGGWGIDDGQFNYPNDIMLDNTGRIYTADRENNRIQVWSY
jgi:DNA-binding beta-propeller fold protein YncE